MTDTDSSTQLKSTNHSWRPVGETTTTVYRIQGLPKECTISSLKSALENSLWPNQASNVLVHSLAISANYPSEKTATVTCHQTSEKLPESQSEWTFEAPLGAFVSAEGETIIRISVDTHFHGFTSLYIPDAEHHSVEYVRSQFTQYCRSSLSVASRYQVLAAMHSGLSRPVDWSTCG